MSKVTGGDTDVESLQIDVCATWASVQGLLDGVLGDLLFVLQDLSHRR